MKLADIIQMQKDLSNGVVLSQISIGKLIVHALMREVEAEQRTLDNQTLRNDNHYLKQQLNEAKAMTTIKTLDQRIEDAAGATVTVAEQLEMSRAEVAELKQALADSNLALMEQTELAQKAIRDVSDLYDLYDRQRQDGNEIARLTEIAQAANRQAEEARTELEDWRFTNKIDELQREIDRHRVQARAPVEASEDLRNKLMYAAIDCGHAISYNEITLYREDGQEGNALHQLSERLIAAALAAPKQHAQAETREQIEQRQRATVAAKFENRAPTPATADFDLPAESDSVEHAQAAQLYADNGQQHEDPTGPNHPGHHDGHTCEAMGQMLADFGSQRTTPEAVVAGMDAQAVLPREPTQAMLTAARDWSVAKMGRGVGNGPATECWQAMYDAAMTTQQGDKD